MRVALLVVAVLALTHGISNIKEHGRKILLKSGVIDTTVAPAFERHTSTHLVSQQHKALFAAGERPGKSATMVHVSSVDAKATLESFLGTTITTYLPHNTFVVHVSEAQVEQLSGLDGVLWVNYLPSAAKIDKDSLTTLKNGFRQSYTLSIKDGEQPQAVLPEKLLLSVYSDVQHTQQWQDELNAQFPMSGMSFEVTRASSRRVVLTVKPTDANPLQHRSRTDLTTMYSALHDAFLYMADKSEVSWIQIKRQPVIKNKYSRWVIQTQENDPSFSGDGWTTPLYTAGLDGAGVTVGVGDTGLDYTHCHFVDPDRSSPGPKHRKVYHYEPFEDNTDYLGGHGTHVSGSVTAAAIDDDSAEFNGMAPGAKIWFFDIGDSQGNLNIPDDLYNEYFQLTYTGDVQLHSNSWGCGLGPTNPPTFCNVYDSDSADIDEFAYDKDDFLVLVAAGNDGDTSIYGNIGSPATAKNILAVGATSNTFASWEEYTGYDYSAEFLDFNSEQAMAYFSSSGPNSDGRLGPTVAAPGYFIQSTNSSGPNGAETCSTLLEAGTSMATPTTAGTAALVQQYFQDGFYPMGTSISDNRFRPSSALMKAALINGATPMLGGQKNPYAVQPLIALYEDDTLGTGTLSGQSYTFFTASGQKTSGDLVSLGARAYYRYQTGSGNDYAHIILQSYNGDCDLYIYSDSATTDLVDYSATGNSLETVTIDIGGVASTLYIVVYNYGSYYSTVGSYAISVMANDDVDNSMSVPTASCSDTLFDVAASVVYCPTTCTQTGTAGNRAYDGTGPICSSARHNGVIDGTGTSGLSNDYFAVSMGVWVYGAVTIPGSTANGITSEDWSPDDGDLVMLFSVGTPYLADVETEGFVDDAPNMFSGYGRIDVSSILKISGTAADRDFDILTNRFDDSVSNGASNEYCFTISSTSLPVKVTLVWTDPAASTSSSLQLVNNLDLEVTTDSCTSASDDDTWLGNNGGSADEVNNVEQVVILNPGAGCNFCASVIGTTVPTGPQRYALVASSGGTLTQTGDTDIFATSGDSCVGCGSPDSQIVGAGSMVSASWSLLVATIAAAFILAF